MAETVSTADFNAWLQNEASKAGIAPAQPAEPANYLASYGIDYRPDLGTDTVDDPTTANVLAKMKGMYSGPGGALRSLKDAIPQIEASEASPILSRIARTATALPRAGLNTAANWLQGTPEIGPDTIAPLGLAGMGAAIGPRNAVGVFGGRLAKTADKDALAQAEKMAAEGLSRDDIWDKTGWFQGVDGKWRFETDDSNARMSYWHRQGFLNQVLKDKPLYEAYPDVGEIPVRHIEGTGILTSSGGYSVPQKRGGLLGMLGFKTPEKIEYNPWLDRSSENGPSRPSTLLHEAQHAIQEREDFARGAGWGAIYDLQHQDPAQYAKIVAQEMDNIRAYHQRMAPRNTTLQERMASPQYEDQLRKSAIENLKREGAYKLSAGEAEARNVQMRLHMTPEERRATPPWKTQDTPDDRQIVLLQSDQSKSSTPGTLINGVNEVTARKGASFTDAAGYTVHIVPGENLGHPNRRGQMIIEDPQGRKIDSGFWMDYPEPGWTHKGINLLDDFDKTVRETGSTAGSVWASIPVEQRLAIEARHQATAYDPLKEQFAFRKAMNEVTARKGERPFRTRVENGWLVDPGPVAKRAMATDAERAEFTKSQGWAGVNFEPEEAMKFDRSNPNRGTAGQVAILDPSAVRILKNGERPKEGELVAYHGTNTAFDKIDPSKFQTIESSGDIIGNGFYGFLRKDLAQGHAEGIARANGGKPHVVAFAVDKSRVPSINYDSFENALQHWLTARKGEPAAAGKIVPAFRGSTAVSAKDFGPTEDLSRLVGMKVPKATFFGSEAGQANAFTKNMAGGTPPTGAGVYPVHINTEGFKEIDWPKYAGQERWHPHKLAQALVDAEKEGAPGIVIRGMKDAGGSADQYAVLDLSRVRSKYGEPAAAGRTEGITQAEYDRLLQELRRKTRDNAD